MKKPLLLLLVVFCFMIGYQDKQVIADLEPYKSQTEIEGYKQIYGMYLSAMGESHIEIEKLIAEGDFVMSQARIQATQNCQLGEIPPTGKARTVEIFNVFRLVDGKIAEEWEIMEELAMMPQLGLELK